MTYDVYPGVKYLITAGHSYVGQNNFIFYRISSHSDHQNIYLWKVQKNMFSSQVALTLLFLTLHAGWKQHIGWTSFHWECHIMYEQKKVYRAHHDLLMVSRVFMLVIIRLSAPLKQFFDEDTTEEGQSRWCHGWRLGWSKFFCCFHSLFRTLC